MLLLACQICGVTCEVDGYDPAPSEMLVMAFSEAHKHTAQDWSEYRRQEHEMFSGNYDGGDDDE